MPIDYSKWDKIELSDDSDIEVHPNVDKRSFIKWKQRDIHEKRLQRNTEIKTLKIQREMYTQLNKRVDSMLSKLDLNQIADESTRNSFLASNFDASEKCTIEEDQQNNPTYNEMVEDLFTQITEDISKEGKDAKNGSIIVDKLKEHRAKIDAVLKEIDPKLDQLLQEKALHISSEDIHEGFDSVIINKSATSKIASSRSPGETVKTTTIETINNPQPTVPLPDITKAPSQELSTLGELDVLDETLEFSKIDVSQYRAIARFLDQHPYIISEQQQQALTMKAFDAQLEGNSQRAFQIVHQALVIQYVNQLCGARPKSEILPSYKPQETAIKLFIGKLTDKNHPARKAFEEDVKRTFTHILERCKILAEENKAMGEEQVEQIQLRSMDEGTELMVTIPQENTPEYEAFLKIPKVMQDALRTSSIDEVNKVFSNMSVPEAEKILELFDQSGAISVAQLLENEEEFDKLKHTMGDQSIDQEVDNLALNDKPNEEAKTEDVVD
ncbi:Hsp90p co-chaperone [Komagataella phaffii CBS 7435]|uniref:Hsp90 chaperone protein kinase-targeting subunit n=2 Tax=Komagataella phaffii TaxID=460519 RepID=C4R0B6_KOMPG|nr:uncharacterized protein PAS_chr2-1_0828 [Komagataella phaffii GS115]AOA62057.1 GQ67_00362T0 [Komagataella phaffii]CAH2448554.1 Hsp90p co-chaperone [Komagataella phaffii CBS 7435]AOA67118.1 GQ68_01027T0 [Komagataella phaffii GS115]CAY68940.1 hypothetical protein PAS_chr2-1_0828 [Komagataella phaffii GS115]CCA38658.1 Hsp90p co-chaperone [Komagataella phaffii CBS 7435]